jgi:hypothetical protein
MPGTFGIVLAVAPSVHCNQVARKKLTSLCMKEGMPRSLRCASKELLGVPTSKREAIHTLYRALTVHHTCTHLFSHPVLLEQHRTYLEGSSDDVSKIEYALQPACSTWTRTTFSKNSCYVYTLLFSIEGIAVEGQFMDRRWLLETIRYWIPNHVHTRLFG